jgi:hypothetical protein
METECASWEVRTGLLVLLQVASISQLTVIRLSRQCGILNISQYNRPPLSVTGIAIYYIRSLFECVGIGYLLGGAPSFSLYANIIFRGHVTLCVGNFTENKALYIHLVPQYEDFTSHYAFK